MKAVGRQQAAASASAGCGCSSGAGQRSAAIGCGDHRFALGLTAPPVLPTRPQPPVALFACHSDASCAAVEAEVRRASADPLSCLLVLDAGRVTSEEALVVSRRGIKGGALQSRAEWSGAEPGGRCCCEREARTPLCKGSGDGAALLLLTWRPFS